MQFKIVFSIYSSIDQGHYAAGTYQTQICHFRFAYFQSTPPFLHSLYINIFVMRRYQEEATPAEDQPEVSEGFASSICSTNTAQQDWMISVFLLV